MTNKPYVLITAAHNEEAYIENTIRSIISQTHLPRKWIIVSDGSTDRTDQIVVQYARKEDYIQLVSLPAKHSRDFASKVNALQAGYHDLNSTDYEFVGILDADISVDADYYRNVLDRFYENERLGIAGGFICEKQGDHFYNRQNNSNRSVAGAVQLFRRECYEEIGGILPLKYGGEDWCAEITARMKGWEVRAFPELKIFHHRATGRADRLLRYWARQGRMDFAVGSHPLFEIVKCMRRLSAQPVLVGALSRFAAFGWSYLRGEDRSVPPEVMQFLRTEQMSRLLAFSKACTPSRWHRVSQETSCAMWKRSKTG